VYIYVCVYIYIYREREREREREMIKKKLDREKWGAKRREGRYLRREAEWKGVTVGLEKKAMVAVGSERGEGEFSYR
jgi:hypothetical protein